MRSMEKVGDEFEGEVDREIDREIDGEGDREIETEEMWPWKVPNDCSETPKPPREAPKSPKIQYLFNKSLKDVHAWSRNGLGQSFHGLLDECGVNFDSILEPHFIRKW